VREVLARLAAKVPHSSGARCRHPARLRLPHPGRGVNDGKGSVGGRREIMCHGNFRTAHAPVPGRCGQRCSAKVTEIKPFQRILHRLLRRQETGAGRRERGCIEDVSHPAGRLRPSIQVELSQTDAILVGLTLGIRPESGGPDP